MLQINKFTILLLLIFSSGLYAANPISGKFKNGPATGKIYLYEYFGFSYYVVDSTNSKNGEFKFSPKLSYPRGFYQLGTSKENSFILILANEEITVDGDWNDLKAGTTIKNSLENDSFKKMISFNNQLSAFEGYVKEIAPLQEKSPIQYQAKLAELQRKYDSINVANNAFKADVITNKSNLFFSKVLKMFSLDEKTPKETFFTQAEFTDPEYTRGDMLMNKINFYLQKYGNSDEATWKNESEELAQKFPPKSKNKELALINIVQVFMQNQLKPSKIILDGLKTEFKTSKRAQEFIASLPRGELQEGESAPDIILEDINGKKLPLSSLKGKIVLIDFWASWCGPCRMENPNVVKIYNKYKDKGFTIYSVSLDNAKQNWLNAIQKDGLMWENHVSDLKGWLSEGAALYQVHAIPATFLIDKDGIIIAKNLRGSSLEQKLAELLP